MNAILDSILRLLEKEKWYVDYHSICMTFNISDDQKDYILSKLDNDGFIEILRTKDSLDIRISDSGRIFINESSYQSESDKIKTETLIQSRQYRLNVIFKILTIIFSLTTIVLGYLTLKNDSKITELEQINNKLKTERLKIDKVITENHFFSNTETMDTFKLQMSGESILSSKIVLTITNSSGIQIFYKDFESTDLIGYGLIGVNNPTINDQENYILKRFYNFFDRSNFHKPAISKDEIIDPDYYDPQYFDLIKKQANSISFIFLIGEENTIGIVYILDLKKAVKFWSCC
jgi:hypothetical protein